MEDQLIKIMFSLIDKGGGATPAKVRQIFEQKEVANNLDDSFRDYIDWLKLTKSSKGIYYSSLKHFENFEGVVKYADLEKDFAKKFMSFMLERGIRKSSAVQYLSKFKKFIKDVYSDQQNTPKLLGAWSISYSTKYRKPYLIPEEREIWENSQPETEREEAIKDIGIFLMEMNYRFGEAYHLKPSSLIFINVGGEPKSVLQHVKNKQKEGEFEQWRKPLTPKASVIWHKYKGVLPFHFFVKSNLQTSYFNDLAKEYAKKIGLDRDVIDRDGEPAKMWQMITSHIFRHTFARRKWREEGKDPIRIGLALGHSDRKSINSYLDPSDVDGFEVFY